MLSWQVIRQQVFVHRKALLLANIFALCSVLLSVPLPLMIPLLVDEVLLNQPAQLSEWLSLILPTPWSTPVGFILCVLVFVLLLRTVSLGLDVLQSQCFTRIGKDISFLLRQRLLDHLAISRLQEFEALGAASVSSRCIVDVETIDDFVSRALSRFLINVLTVIGTLLVLFYINWILALVLICLNPAMIIFARSFGQRVRTMKSEENLAFEHLQQALVETLNAIQQIKSHRQEGPFFARISHCAEVLKAKAIASQWKTEAIFQVNNTVYLAGYELFRVLAMFMVLFSGLSIGQMFAVFAYLWFLMGPIQEMLSLQYAYNQADGALARLNELLQLKTEQRLAPAQATNPFQDTAAVTIRFDNVSFGYSAQNPVLDRVNLTIAAGSKTALVAVSGGGKSTLVNLMLGLYEKTSGDILINEVSVANIGYDLIREHIVTVQQQPVFFNASLRQNLTQGRVDVTDDALWQALELAELDNTVQGLPDGLDSSIGRDGVKFSGGQRQRLMIARMLLNPAPVIVLDEALSAVDALTEARILANLQPFMRDKTVLIISHRLSVLRQVDMIYVLEDGSVRQAGSHSHLLQQDGLYNTLYALQS
ncbi:ABC transporter ATP-binding protein [Rheinheimera sp. FR7-31]|uniref:ABC transporter ATP-binding protein n=1 Tax=Rheinheimera fenheensis TaxID=3152295 RepID=UPI00325C3B46